MTKTKAVDLSIFDVVTGANAGFDLEIRTPAGAKSGVVFRLLGSDSDVYQKIDAAQRKRRMEAAAKAGRFVSDPDQQEEDEVEKLVAGTLGWSNLSVEFSKEKAEAIYRDKTYSPIREQVAVAIHDRANFSKG